MPPKPLINDGLWRCLCPSFRLQTTVRRLLRVQSQSITHSRRRPAVASQPTPFPCSSSRRYTTTPALAPFTQSPSSRSNGSLNVGLVNLDTRDLYNRLRKDAEAGRHEDVMRIVKILLKDRREQPNVTMYSAILQSFTSPELGTAGKIRKVFEEMREDGIQPDSAACHGALEALAVHPDYLLRNEILEYMQERWFTLSDRGHNMVVAGLLRDRSFEQALEKMDAMIQQGVYVAPWLYDKTMYLLLDYGEIDEAYQLALARQNSPEKGMSQSLWLQLLDSASRFHHAEAVDFAWNSQVEPGYLKPPNGTCMNVLGMAARNGNVKLATDVFRVLTERQTVFDQYHYELLLEAYLQAEDLQTALSVLLIMNESGIKVEEQSAAVLYAYLHQAASRPMEAFDILQTFELSGRKVPTAGVNACINASIQLEKLEEAIEIYKALHTVSRAGPNTATFNILLQGCHKANRKELAIFLVNEMLQLKVRPDALTYDRLVLVCCSAQDIGDAFLYYDEMRSQGHLPRQGTYELLIRKGIDAQDSRTMAVYRDMQENKVPIRRGLDMLVKQKAEDALGPAYNDQTGLPSITGAVA